MKKIIYLFIVFVLVCACQSGRKYFGRDVKDAEVKIVRFDEALLQTPSSSPCSGGEKDYSQLVEELYREYPEFMDVWVEDILGMQSAKCIVYSEKHEDYQELANAIGQFLEDTVYGFKETNAKEQEVWADVSDIQKRLNRCFGRLQSLYPEWKVPTVYVMVSGFQTGLYFVNDTMVAVGADMYLGADWEYYNKLVYNYQKKTMRKECVVADIVSAYLFRKIDYTAMSNKLLDQMIYRGKVMYLLSLVDEEPEYEIMGWSKDQWEWCKRNERGIWGLMMDKRDLYKNEALTISGYLNDGPFASEVSQDCPARVGTWIGWHIVKSYMEANEDVSLQELMLDGDGQKILTKSKYKP